jgi:hypothetical protein
MHLCGKNLAPLLVTALYFVKFEVPCFPSLLHLIMIPIFNLLVDSSKLIPLVINAQADLGKLTLCVGALGPNHFCNFCWGFRLPHARTGGVLIFAQRREKHTNTIFNVVRQNRLHPRESPYY